MGLGFRSSVQVPVQALELGQERVQEQVLLRAPVPGLVQ
jgi:hypothetical protein